MTHNRLRLSSILYENFCNELWNCGGDPGAGEILGAREEKIWQLLDARVYQR